jgi:phosphorylcholine metabolism protein LicD
MIELDKAFHLVCEIFNAHDIPFWLEAGSLLGCVRGGRRIEWDDDYDIGFPYYLAHKVLDALQELREYGYDVNGNLYHSISYKGKHLICIQPHKIINGHMYRIDSYLQTEYHISKLPIFLQHLILSLQIRFNLIKYHRGSFNDYSRMFKLPMNGELVYIPIGYDRILRLKYGDWRTPRKN